MHRKSIAHPILLDSYDLKEIRHRAAHNDEPVEIPANWPKLFGDGRVEWDVLLVLRVRQICWRRTYLG